jgi:ankyrin repeat protein
MNDRDKGGQTAVAIAAQNNHLEVVKELLARGAGVGKEMTVIRSSPSSFSLLYVMVVRMETPF